MEGGFDMEKTYTTDSKMDQFMFDLSDAVELEAIESMWYVFFGSGFCIVVNPRPAE